MTAPIYTPVEMIKRLVSFDTTSRDSNLGLIRFVESYLDSHGVESTLVFNEDRSKANLLATIGPNTLIGGVALSGHSDVVPVEGQDWSSDPFEVVERDGRLYGRGTCDMKGFLAIALALVPEFKAHNLKRPVHIVLTYDEETDCSGAMRFLEAMAPLGLAPQVVIIGEPTGMQVVNAHKGHYCLETRIIGHEAHASLTHLGVNAISIAVRLITFLEELVEELKSEAVAMPGLMPPYTTINVGTINGGTQFNIVPGACSFEWEIRPVPGRNPKAIIDRFNAYAESLLPEMRKVAPNAGISTTVKVAVPAFVPQQDSPAETLILSLARTNEAQAVTFGTEAPCYQQTGWSVIVFGPGSMEQAHKPDEYLSLQQVDACVRFMRALMQRLSQE